MKRSVTGICGIIVVGMLATGCATRATLMCIDDIPDSPCAYFVEMGSIETHFVKMEAIPGKIYKNVKIKPKENNCDPEK